VRIVTEPSLLSPNQRLAAISALLAGGLRRLRDASPGPASTSAENLAQTNLDVSPITRLNVTRVNAPERS
jgi:hypothetical protein